jgi:hypothetical protein
MRQALGRALRHIAALAGLTFLVENAMSSQSPPSPPQEAITRVRALEIARKAVSESKPEVEFVILEDKTAEKEFGWVFFYTTKKYLETKDPRTLIPGSAPLVVERAGGRTHHLDSSLGPDKAIEEFEKRWRKDRKAKD